MIKIKLENTYINLPDVFYSKQEPSHVPNPKLVAFNYSLAEKLGLDVKCLESSEGIDILSGNKVLEGTTPIAQAYAGHQFGYFTILGDGRAVLLGELITPENERLDIQLKGSGETQYSRGGDGKASLGPMLREFIISEAMYGLGIPTTRSLAVVETGETVIREKLLPGAVLTRIASSHIRVGTFQYITSYGKIDDLRALADYTIERHYKELINEENKYFKFLKEVIKKQADLISKWQLVGFIHGVMNTDNMTISGETIDYGPCAFMDVYNPSTVFSSIDRNGRYAYGNQPNIGAWNLARFAESLLPLLSDDKDEAINMAQDAIAEYPKIFKEKWLAGMRAKLGLFTEEAEDEHLIEGLLSIMNKYGADFTNTFRSLTIGSLDEIKMADEEGFKGWYKLWQQRLSKQDKTKEEVMKLMKDNNPSIIPRNHRVEEALDAAVKANDYSIMDKLLDVIKNPYEYSKEQEEYTSLPGPTKTPYRTFCGT